MAETIKTVLEADTRNFTSEFAKARSSLETFHKRILSIGAVLGGAAVFKGAVDKFRAIANSIDKMNDSASRLEMPVEEMQRLNAVATMSGASVESLAKALTRSKLNAVEATSGSVDLANSFATLGINAAEFVNLGATEQLIAISKGMNSAADQGKAFSAVFGVMGRGAAELIPLLRGGEEQIAAISKRLQVLGGEDIAAVARMNDEIEILSNNLGTKMSGALLALRPQIEGFIKIVSDAADGLSVLMSPGGGTGGQGGTLGGANILREIDTLEARIQQIKSQQLSGVAWYEGPLGLNLELKKSVAAVETLKTRYSALDQEAQLYSGQLIAVERLRKSGASEEILTREVEAMQNRTAESKRAIDAEKALATASADTLSKMSQQADEAQSIASSLASLQTSVGKRVMDTQSPEVRRDASRQNLRTVLDGEGAGSLEDLRKKVGGSTNDGDKAKALNALSKGLDILEEIRRANQEIAAAEEARTSASIAGSERERAETDKTREAKERLAEVESDQGRAREEFAASITALKAEAAGRNDLAESLRSEIALRSEAVTLSKQLGISEEEMIKKLRDRASIAERIKAQSGGLGAGKGTSGRRSNIGIDENPPGNNLQDWKWRLQRGMPRIESPSFKRVAPLQSNSLRDGELQRRSNHRSMTSARADNSAKFLAELVQVAREGNEMWRNMGMV